MASVCRSLQCLISALTQAGGGGLLFRLLVPALCGEWGGALFSQSALLRLPAVLYGGCPALCTVPALRCSTKVRTRLRLRFVRSSTSSSSGSQELDWRTLPGWSAPSPLRGPSLSFRARQSGACAFSPLHPQPQSPPTRSGACTLCLAETLPADVDHPESQEVFG